MAVRKHVLILFRANSRAFRAVTEAVVGLSAQRSKFDPRPVCVCVCVCVCVFACVGFVAYKVAL